MTNKYSYFFEQTAGNNARKTQSRYGGGGGRRKPSTKNQRDTYYALCERKNVPPARIEGWTFDQASKEIQRLIDLPQPASPAQKERIKTLIAEMIELGAEIQQLSDEEVSKLTGGRDGTASSLLSTLIEKRKEMNEFAPPTEQQLQIIVPWFMCPDIPFDSWGIDTRITVEKMTSFSTGEAEYNDSGAYRVNGTVTSESGSQVELNESYWRLMLPNEFAEELKRKLTQKKANEFIGKYQSDYYAWSNTRLTRGQEKQIRQLEEELGTLEPTSFGVEFILRDGEFVEEQVVRPPSRNRLETNDAYTPMSEMELKQLSFEQASKHISRLRYERSKMREIETMYGEEGVYDESQDFLEEKGSMEVEGGSHMKVRTHADAKQQEYNKMVDLVFGIEAILGHNVDKAHEIVGASFKEGVSDNNETNLAFTEDELLFMKEFFLATVTNEKDKDIKRWARDIDRLYMMCEDIPTALEILGDINDM